jgi:hypothetical protein
MNRLPDVVPEPRLIGATRTGLVVSPRVHWFNSGSSVSTVEIMIGLTAFTDCRASMVRLFSVWRVNNFARRPECRRYLLTVRSRYLLTSLKT